jgi:transaldolase
MTSLDALKVKLFADGADRQSMLAMYAKPYIKGLTTNPTLMRKAGVVNYRDFAREVLAEINDKPICFEVLADDFAEMERQAVEISSWADNVYVKIPITNTRGEFCTATVERLTKRNVKLNVTAIMTLTQLERVLPAINPGTPSYVSIFAGRIADTGIDPVPFMAKAAVMLKALPKVELMWASSREVLNIFQANAAGCHIITVTTDILNKLPLIDRDLAQLSLETVKMFDNDARSAGYSLDQ